METNNLSCKLLLMMEELNFSDVFRKKNPSKKSFTYESKYLKVKSRIDFFSGVNFHYEIRSCYRLKNFNL